MVGGRVRIHCIYVSRRMLRWCYATLFSGRAKVLKPSPQGKILPVVPRKAVAQVSKIGNLKEILVVVNHGWQSGSTAGSTIYPPYYPIYPCLYSPMYLSIHLSIYLFIYLSIFLSIDLSIYRSIYLSINQSINIYHYLSLSIMIYHDLSLSIYLSSINYHYLSLSIIIYHYLSIYLAIYHYLSKTIITYHYLSLSSYLSIYLPIYLSIYFSFLLSIYLSSSRRENEAILRDFLNFWTWQHRKRSNSARLPQFLIFDVGNIKNEASLRDFLNFWSWKTSKTKQFCQTSFENGKLSAVLTASYQFVLQCVHSICLKYCTCHEKVRPAVTQPEDHMLQNATPLRKLARWPPNILDEHVSSIAPATWKASLQIIFKRPMPAILFATATKPSRFTHFRQGAESFAPARQNDASTSKSGANMWCL